ncbi:MAG: glycerol dehydrogenase [Eubacteriales bacterium]
MKRIFISPLKYVHGEGELGNLGAYVKEYAKKALLVASKEDQKRVQILLDKAMQTDSFDLVYGEFGEECTKKEIERMQKLAEENGCGLLIGLGGGKALDTAKAAACQSGKPVIIVPTIASTDAPTSKLAIIYTEDSRFEEYFHLKQNPNIVLVDTGVIAKAPARFLVAGMGDALSTYFEARSCIRSGAKNMPGGQSTKAAFAIARACYETLMEDSYKAKIACDNNVVTPALENIIEANILLSGLGFESSGLAACHSIHNGLTVLEETHRFFHGEKVAFGVLVHLVLENAPMEEIEKIIGYCKQMGLPTCLLDLGIENRTIEKIQAVSEAACAPGETIHNMPFPVTPKDVFGAILIAEKLGSKS